MRRIVLLLMLLLSVPAMAGVETVDELFAAYSGRDGYKTVVLGRKILSVMSKEDGAMSDVIGRINRIRVLSTEKSDTAVVNSALRIAEKEYELFSQNIEDMESTSFYIREENDRDRSFLMVAHRTGQEIIMEISGDFKVTEISKLSKFGTSTTSKH